MPSLSKSDLRRRLVNARKAMTPSDHSQWSQAIAERLAAIIPPSRSVAGYAAIRAEVNVLGALSFLNACGHITALPRVGRPFHPLVFHGWEPGDILAQGAYAIDEPAESAPVILPDILIVPLVGFDRRGHRLGYGRGYYDITLAHLRNVNPTLLAIGAAFSLQEVPSLCVEAHDERLDRVVTEKEVIEIGRVR